MKRATLYFGSFNPVHIGHMAVANYLTACGYTDELWFVVSPLNPLKDSGELAPERERLAMANIAVRACGMESVMKVSDVEFGLEKPSFTIDTLRYLWREYPGVEFSVLMGADNLAEIELWKEYKEILSKCEVFVYPRPGVEIAESKMSGNIKILKEAPLLEISSTGIRKLLTEGKKIPALMPCGVYEYIVEKEIYGTNGRGY